MSTSDLKKELTEVTTELEQVEIEIECLLSRQQELITKRSNIQDLLTQISTSNCASTSVASTRNYDAAEKFQERNFDWSDKVKQLLRDQFHIKEFRSLQLQTINATLSGEHVLLIMPTGGGKSICYQLPTMVKPGFTLVISPLVSLMEDQVSSLETLGIQGAVMLNASSSQTVVKETMDRMTLDPADTLKLIYVTPEKLAKSKRFMSKLQKAYELGRINRFAIDEVHCCSQWGHDFRPDYKFLNILHRQFPGTPLLGVTATATADVLKDVQKILGIPKSLIFRASYNRKNLFYEVRHKQGSAKESIVDLYNIINKEYRNQSGIVYCFSQKNAEEVTSELQLRGIKAGCYHANLDSRARSSTHSRWTNNELLVIVATIAFGMGIDKSNVRFVIHYSLSKSLDNYYQESGRAGRDDQRADCLVLWRFGDLFRLSSMVFTEQTGLSNIYAMARYCIEANGCRRRCIARHFMEVYDESQCQQMCDNCQVLNKGYVSSKVDITNLYKQILELLQQQAQQQKNPRITGLKLIDLMSTTAFTSKAQSLPANIETRQQQNERVVTWLLLEDYLKEDFHFTPYSTISYVVPGSKAGVVRTGKCIVEMNFQTRRSWKGAAESPATTSITKSNSQPVVKSNSSIVVNDIDKGISQKPFSSQKPASRKRKLREIICLDDSDGEFDFAGN